MTSLNELYQQELDLLKQSAKTFSDEYPALTTNLVRDSTDPDVDMILKGVAYLTAQLRKEITDDFPVALQALSQVLTPSLMQPSPAATIMDFTPKANLLKPFVISAGKEFDTLPLARDAAGNPVHCRFANVWDVTALPISVQSVSHRVIERNIDGSQRKLQQLNIEFDASRNDLANYEFDKLRFYFDLPQAQSTTWMSLFSQHLESVNVIDANGERHLPSASVGLAGFDTNNDLAQDSGSSSVHKLLQEYFLFPEKFGFLDISLAQWQQRGGAQFSLVFEFKQPNWAVPDLKAENIRLFAAPAVNYFSGYAEPVKLSGFDTEIRLSARNRALAGDQKLEIIAVETVETVQRGREQSRAFQNLLKPQFLSDDQAGYHFYQRHGDQDDETVPWLALHQVSRAEEVLRVGLVCCNGELGAKVAPGDVRNATGNSPELVTFTNLTAGSQFHPASVVSESAWQVVSDQALSLSSINNGAQLKQLLAHHIPAKLKDSARQKTNLHQINSIDSLVVLNTEIIRQGKLIRGCEYRVVVNGEHFTSAGELFLFGSLLDQLFGLQMSLNNFSRLTVTDLQTGDSSEWSTRLGATWAI